MDDKLKIRNFETENELIHYCNGLFRWQIVSISFSHGVYTLFFWVGAK